MVGWPKPRHRRRDREGDGREARRNRYRITRGWVVLQVCRNGRINRPIWYSALRYVTCSSGVNLNRKSFCWLWDGTCAFRSPTGMWKSSWPSAAFFPIMSPYGDGYSVTVQKWSGVCARGSNPPTIVGGWMKPMCVLKANGATCTGQSIPTGTRSTSCSPPHAMPTLEEGGRKRADACSCIEQMASLQGTIGKK